MTRLDRLDIDDIPEEYHHLFTDEYLGDRYIFRVWAHNLATSVFVLGITALAGPLVHALTASPV